MTYRGDFLQQVGKDGLPAVVDKSLDDSWQLCRKGAETETEDERILAVLGFFHLVRQAGMQRYIKMKSDPAKIYKQIRQEELNAHAKDIAAQISSLRVFDALRVFKSKYQLVKTLRGNNRTLRVDLCLVPKRSETLDGTLSRLKGTLYYGDLPKQLQENWKKLSPNSNAKPRSALDRYQTVMNTNSTLDFLPLFASKNIQMHTRRAKDDTLIIRITTTVPSPSLPWMPDRKHDALLQTLFTKAFANLRG